MVDREKVRTFAPDFENRELEILILNFQFQRVRGRAVVARRAHNPEVVGSNPSPATKIKSEQDVSPAFFMWMPGESLLSGRVST